MQLDSQTFETLISESLENQEIEISRKIWQKKLTKHFYFAVNLWENHFVDAVVDFAACRTLESSPPKLAIPLHSWYNSGFYFIYFLLKFQNIFSLWIFLFF